MTESEQPREEQTLTTAPMRFWTWDIKLLVVINIVFLLLIIAGLITVLSALSPAIYHYVVRAFS